MDLVITARSPTTVPSTAASSSTSSIGWATRILTTGSASTGADTPSSGTWRQVFGTSRTKAASSRSPDTESTPTAAPGTASRTARRIPAASPGPNPRQSSNRPDAASTVTAPLLHTTGPVSP